MRTPRRKYQLTLDSLREILLNSKNLSNIGMKSTSRGVILNFLSLIFRQLGDIPKIFLKVTTQKSIKISFVFRKKLSSGVSTPLTPSPQIPTFDNFVKQICKSLIAAFTSKDAVLKEVRDYILANNENRIKELNPYIQSY